eukprot:TRINITY_DN93668_c0_g1_i1.p1 TRINITY_DN93668_c0_g1~~TRINITY_DN93668_c0_g1_i1.p1  ORF type:complete len:195 (-),score=40.19 TRINITY_DN93668_c0_g1_i1:44-562(-)
MLKHRRSAACFVYSMMAAIMVPSFLNTDSYMGFSTMHALRIYHGHQQAPRRQSIVVLHARGGASGFDLLASEFKEDEIISNYQGQESGKEDDEAAAERRANRADELLNYGDDSSIGSIILGKRLSKMLKVDISASEAKELLSACGQDRALSDFHLRSKEFDEALDKILAAKV